jgi:triacylglycerol lipase
VLGNYISEDCLKLNVIKPSGIKAGVEFQWLSRFTAGGCRQLEALIPDRICLLLCSSPLTYLRAAIVAVSINYLLRARGFPFGGAIAK